MTYVFRCRRCGALKDLSRPVDRRNDPVTCSHCETEPMERLFGQGVSWQYTYGRDDFHGPTVNERREEQLRLTPNAEPVGQRWV